ncbi:MAG: hypothetical protein K6G30_07315 [Acetatifactor sp.]|nr:hypothetical protein [Acetatifactor sp.]
MERKFELSPRIENVREVKPVVIPVQFELAEIKHHFDESVQSIISQFTVAESLVSSGQEAAAKNIFRSQIVFIEGVLDFYMHEITKYGLYKIFIGEWSRTEKYSKLSVSMADVDRALHKPDAKEWFFDYVNKSFATVVMQDWIIIRDQLNLIGIPWKDVCQSIHEKMDESHSVAEEKRVLSELYKRRNAIAH